MWESQMQIIFRFAFSTTIPRLIQAPPCTFLPLDSGKKSEMFQEGGLGQLYSVAYCAEK